MADGRRFRLDFPTTVAGLAIGLAAGTGVFTFLYAKGGSYLSNDPRACANCHVMREQLDGWQHSSHRAVATCNDCHTPHDLFGKAATKARNGFWHSFYFTTGNFHEPIQIKARNREIVEHNCRGCHEGTVGAMNAGHGRSEDLSCVRCHGSVGHP